MADIIVPHVGETTTRVRIIRWLKAEGERVRKGEPLLEVETDKANLTIEAYADGVLDRILVLAGEEADALQVVGVLLGPEDTPVAAPTVERTLPPTEPAQKAAPARGKRQAVSPLARRIAAEQGVDMSSVVGTGPGGMITAGDVRAAAERSAPAPARAETAEGVELSRMRKAIGERMLRSKTTVPHFYVAAHVDMSEATKLRKALLSDIEARVGTRLSYTHMMIKALGLAAAQFPTVNATYADGVLTRHTQVNVGLAVALAEGLIVPVMKDAARKGLPQIAAEADELVRRAHEGRLTTNDVEDGTITLTNLGGSEIEFFVAIINPPECAIVATGEIAPRPVVVDRQVVVHPTMFMVVSGDHRVLDGATLARFLRTMKGILEDPSRLLDQD